MQNSFPVTVKAINVGIFYAADLMGAMPSGVDTFIRGIIRWAPDDIKFSLIGATMDQVARPVGKWTECDLTRNCYQFFPLYAFDDPKRQPRIPASLTFTLRLFRKARMFQFDIIESHRIESFLPYLFAKTPKNAFFHQNMEVLRNKNSDIRWKYFPWLFYKLEDKVIRRLDSVFVVREDAAETYRRRYPAMADRIHFIPTWMDPDLFYSATQQQREKLRLRLFGSRGFKRGEPVAIFVGRLDKQKDPILLIESFAEMLRSGRSANLVIVGDGVLRPKVERRVKELGMTNRVLMTGLLSAPEVSEYLQASDLFVLSSAYEGMPMAVLEAMGCGLPVATTEVGEIRRLVEPGVNGAISADRTKEQLGEAIISCLENLHTYSGAPSVNVAAEYIPAKVLEPVYENYRRLVLHV